MIIIINGACNDNDDDNHIIYTLCVCFVFGYFFMLYATFNLLVIISCAKKLQILIYFDIEND